MLEVVLAECVLGSAGVLAPGRWRGVRALGWAVTLTVAIVLAFNLAARGLGLLLGGDDPSAPVRLAGAIAGSAAVLGIYWLAVHFGERRAVSEFKARGLVKELLLGAAIGLGLVSAIIGLQALFDWVEITVQPVTTVALALRDAIRSGVVEEVVMRLVVFRLAWRALGIWPALALTASLFGMLHLLNPGASLFAALCLAAGEGVAIGLYLLTGRIWAPIAMHASWNFALGWLFGASVSGTDDFAGGPLATRAAEGAGPLLSGGGFGPEASLAALIISLIASAALLALAWRRGGFVPAADAHSARG